MKFAHMADVHIGSWRDPKLKDISTTAFEKAVDVCIYEQVDFVLISGDLFNTALPSIDKLKAAVIKLRDLKQKGIAVYIIPGSHDFSPSGKTMLDVLEEAELLINVVKGTIIDGKLRLKFTVDKKTGAKITGMLGKRGSLETKIYEDLSKDEIENEEGYKIFMFHSALTELKSKEHENMISAPLSLLPKNFDYYAGGHVHEIKEAFVESYGKILYPGPLFPANFKELEELLGGGFYIVDGNKIEYKPIQVYNVFPIQINAQNKTPEKVTEEILEQTSGKEFFNTIVTIRVEGTLTEGKPSEVDFKKVFQALYDKSAYFVMKNTNKLISKEFKEMKIASGSVEELENNLINEHTGQFPMPGIPKEKEREFIKSLINALDLEKNEGERITEFETRIKNNVDSAIVQQRGS